MPATTLHRPPCNTPALEDAVALAARAHAGQLDKAGEPYLLHPLRVMLAVATPEERMAAVLHDVVEDTSVTLEELRVSGYPEVVVRALEALTRRPGETRLESARRAAADPVALAVKLADNADNLDPTRLREPGPADLDRMEQYRAVRAFLLQARDEATR